MNLEHQTTPEEEAYGRLIEESRKTFSHAAGVVISEAENAAYGDNLIRTYAFQPEEYEEAEEMMRLAAFELGDREHELLARLWRAALAAAASINPEDDAPVAYFKARRGDFHWYYRMLSGMVERTLQKKKIAERDTDDFSHIRF